MTVKFFFFVSQDGIVSQDRKGRSTIDCQVNVEREGVGEGPSPKDNW